MTYFVLFQALFIFSAFVSSSYIQSPPKPKGNQSLLAVLGASPDEVALCEEAAKLPIVYTGDQPAQPPLGFRRSRRCGFYVPNDPPVDAAADATPEVVYPGDSKLLTVETDLPKGFREGRFNSDSTSLSDAGGSSTCSSVTHSVRIDGGEGLSAPVVVSGEISSGRPTSGSGESSAARVAELSLPAMSSDGPVLSYSVGCGAGAASGSSADRRFAVPSIDLTCKAYAYDGWVDPYRAGEERGQEIFKKLARNEDGLFKFVCECDRRCGSYPYFYSLVFEDRNMRTLVKFSKFWRSVQRVIIMNFENPLQAGVMHALRRLRGIFTKGSAECVAFVKQCENRLNECCNPCFEKTNRANLLYWAACKMIFTARFFECMPLKESCDYFVLGKEDGLFGDTAERVGYTSVASELIRYCDTPIAHFGRKTDPLSVAMLFYWQGFKAGLEEMLKLAVD